jgi:hypothetical protein
LAILRKFRLAASCRYHLDAESITQAPKQQALKQLVLRRGVAAKRWALNDDEIFFEQIERCSFSSRTQSGRS